MDPKTLLQQRLTQSQAMEKSFGDRLKERRGFVQNQENTASPIFARLMDAPGGEARIPSGDVINPLRNFTTENTRSLQAADADLQRATSSTDNLLQALIQLSESEKDRALRQQELSTKSSTTSAASLEDILKARKALTEQGLDTSSIDAQLTQFGVNSKTGIPEEKQELIDLVDELLASETGSITGLRSMVPDIPGSKAALAGNTLDHLKAKLALDNVARLKGQGQISDKEREMLEKASTKLSGKLSNDQFRAELLKMRKGLGATDTPAAATKTVRSAGPQQSVGDKVLNFLFGGYKPQAPRGIGQSEQKKTSGGFTIEEVK